MADMDMGDDSAMSDPSLLEGNEGEFEDMMMDDGLMGKGGQTASLKNQTLLALQELGIVIGVALMVCIIFMLMVFFETVCTKVTDLYQKRFGNEDEMDAEDPAALVGTFKRYKN